MFLQSESEEEETEQTLGGLLDARTCCNQNWRVFIW